MIFENLGLLVEDEAWLIAGVIAALLLFLIPEPGKARELKDLFLTLLSVIALYAIFLKFRPWLGLQVGQALGTIVSIVLVLAFAFVLLRLAAFRRDTAQPDHAQ